uniref:Uncharacterized protein n=1 Tax=Glossina austeni TaxID=7395 RepID=A0A1A9VL89_GLOAU
MVKRLQSIAAAVAATDVTNIAFSMHTFCSLNMKKEYDTDTDTDTYNINCSLSRMLIRFRRWPWRPKGPFQDYMLALQELMRHTSKSEEQLLESIYTNAQPDYL